MLHATGQGLFEMDWLLICPRCACAVENFDRLRAVLSQYRCHECDAEYEAAIDHSIAIYFSVSPQLCAIRYHRPETLEPDRLHVPFARRARGIPADGVPYIDAGRAVLRAIGFLEPELTAGFEFEAAPGAVDGISVDPMPARMRITGDRGRAATGPPGLSRRRLRARRGRAGAGADRARDHEPTESRAVVAVPQGAAEQDDGFLASTPPHRQHLLTSQTFKSLFRSEVVGGAQGLAIRDIAILFTDIKGSTASTSGSAISTPSSWCSSISTGCARPPSPTAAR